MLGISAGIAAYKAAELATLPQVLTNPLIQQLKIELATLEIESAFPERDHQARSGRGGAATGW